MNLSATIKIKFKSIWYNPKLDLLITPIWMQGIYFYEHQNTGALRVIVDEKEWSYIDFI